MIGIENIFVEDIFGLVRIRIDYSEYVELLCLPLDMSKNMKFGFVFPDTFVASFFFGKVGIGFQVLIKAYWPGGWLRGKHSNPIFGLD